MSVNLCKLRKLSKASTQKENSPVFMCDPTLRFVRTELACPFASLVTICSACTIAIIIWVGSRNSGFCEWFCCVRVGTDRVGRTSRRWFVAKIIALLFNTPGCSTFAHFLAVLLTWISKKLFSICMVTFNLTNWSTSIRRTASHSNHQRRIAGILSARTLVPRQCFCSAALGVGALGSATSSHRVTHHVAGCLGASFSSAITRSTTSSPTNNLFISCDFVVVTVYTSLRSDTDEDKEHDSSCKFCSHCCGRVFNCLTLKIINYVCRYSRYPR